MPPGATTKLHKLINIIERYVILDGEGMVEVGNGPSQKIGPLDVVIIPADCIQKITNIGSLDLVFLAICSPRFTDEAYKDVQNN